MLNDFYESIILSPFVFISYACENLDVASDLYDYLRDHGVNVVFDKGGLPLGLSLPEFEQLILNDNCKRVLMLFDPNYLSKIKFQRGQVWEEYDLIRNNFRSSNSGKFIPVLCDGVSGDDLPVLFNGRTVYERVSEQENIVEICKEAKIDPEQPLSVKEANEYIKKADSCYDSDASKLCIDYLRVVLTSPINGRGSDRIRAKACSIIICMFLTGKIEHSPIVKKAFKMLLKLLEKPSLTKDKGNLPRYLVNCSMYYKKRISYNKNYELKAIDYAERALKKAEEFGYTNLYYYLCQMACTYAAFDALKQAKEKMINAYTILNDEYGGHNAEDLSTSIEVYLRGSEIMIELANKSINDKDMPTANDLLSESEKWLKYAENHLEIHNEGLATQKDYYGIKSKLYDTRKKCVESRMDTVQFSSFAHFPLIDNKTT
jgi:hypothetical protein